MKKNKTNKNNLLTTEEAAKRLKLSLMQLRNYRSRHVGPQVDSKRGNECLFHTKELDSWNKDRLKRRPLASKKINPDIKKDVFSPDKRHMLFDIMPPSSNVSLRPSYLFLKLEEYKQNIQEYKSRLFANKDIIDCLNSLSLIVEEIAIEIESLKKRK